MNLNYFIHDYRFNLYDLIRFIIIIITMKTITIKYFYLKIIFLIQISPSNQLQCLV